MVFYRPQTPDMTTPATPSDPKPAVTCRAVPPAAEPWTAESVEEWLKRIWEQNRNAVYVLCGLVLAGIIAKGIWHYIAEQQEAEVGQEYAAAATPEMLKAFAAAHEGKSLAGVAELQLADAAYAEGRAADAVTAYQKAIAALPAGAFTSRARLGLAISEIQAGRGPEGEEALRQLAGDPNQFKSVRSEAAYQLAVLAAAGGRAEELKRLAEQLAQIDSSSSWTQRAFALQADLPAAAQAPASATGVGIQLGKK